MPEADGESILADPVAYANQFATALLSHISSPANAETMRWVKSATTRRMVGSDSRHHQYSEIMIFKTELDNGITVDIEAERYAGITSYALRATFDGEQLGKASSTDSASTIAKLVIAVQGIHAAMRERVARDALDDLGAR